MKNGKFGTCLNCMDGRVQIPVIQWIQKEYGLDYIDMITEAGIDRLLANKNIFILPILKKIDISLDKHGSKIIFIVGHFDCAGNPVNEETHRKHIRMAVERLKSMISSCKIIGLWVSKEWLAEKIIEEC